MYIVRLWGGIGNQLFQYAFGEFLRYNCNLDVRYDIASFGNSDKLREYELAIIAPNLPTVNNIRFSRYRGIVNRCLRALYSVKNKFVIERDFTSKIIENRRKKSDIYLQGYWQEEKYAKILIEKNLYLPQYGFPLELEAIKIQILSSRNSVALHVRRGDYFNPKNVGTWGVCNVDYYEKAISYVEKLKGDCHIFVFSDDLNWVKDNLKFEGQVTFVPNYEISQFWYIYLMSLCKNNIISNSSFSWWGAYLNKNIEKVVISPTKWNLKTKETIALDSWVKL